MRDDVVADRADRVRRPRLARVLRRPAVFGELEVRRADPTGVERALGERLGVGHERGDPGGRHEAGQLGRTALGELRPRARDGGGVALRARRVDRVALEVDELERRVERHPPRSAAAGSSKNRPTSRGRSRRAHRRPCGGRTSAVSSTTWSHDHLAVDHPRLRGDLPDRQDRGGPRRQDRHRTVDPERADVGDRERRARACPPASSSPRAPSRRGRRARSPCRRGRGRSASLMLGTIRPAVRGRSDPERDAAPHDDLVGRRRRTTS